jgi:hypothetical protein
MNTIVKTLLRWASWVASVDDPVELRNINLARLKWEAGVSFLEYRRSVGGYTAQK